MKIYAENNAIIFECDHDHCRQRLSVNPTKNKRSFMRHLNKFAWQHDNQCALQAKIIENKRQAEQAGKIAQSIIERLNKR
jgi:hypothetical protein